MSTYMGIQVYSTHFHCSQSQHHHHHGGNGNHSHRHVNGPGGNGLSARFFGPAQLMVMEVTREGERGGVT